MSSQIPKPDTVDNEAFHLYNTLIQTQIINVDDDDDDVIGGGVFDDDDT